MSGQRAALMRLELTTPRRLPNDYGRLSGAPSRQTRRHVRYGPYGVGGRRPSLWRYKDGCVLDHPGLERDTRMPFGTITLIYSVNAD